MRILVLDYKDYWHHEAGGSQTYARAMISEFKRMGHEVTVFTCFSDRPRVETVDGVHYFREGTKFTVFHSAKVYLVKHGHEFDVVLDTVNQRPFLAHEIVGNKATALVYHLGLETWNTEFGFPFNVVGRRLLEPEWMRRLRSAPRVLAISQSTAESLARFGVECDGIVPPALPPKDPVLDRTLGQVPRVLFIGRMVNNKRPLDAVNAFLLMKKDFPNLSIDIVGTGYLLDRVREYESSDVRVWGYVSGEAKESLIRNADLLFVTSVREGWGMVVAEAALLGVPAIAYDVPGLKDSIKDGETGILTKESPKELAARATELLSDPEEWSKLSTAAAKWAASWRWPDAAEALMSAMTSRPTREAWVRADPDEISSPATTSDVATRRRFDMSNRATSIAVSISVIAIALGLALRLYEAYHMPWRDDEIVYVQWTGSWFSHHLFSYVFQFQQHLFPPKSPYFANPPFAMWIFGIAIWVGHLFSVSALLCARLADVAISLLTNVMLFRTTRRWLGSTVAAVVACAFALLPIAITTGASAFIEPTLALIAVLALDAYLKLRERASWPHAMYLASVLGLALITKLSLGFVFFLIGLSALIFLIGSGRLRMAAAFALTSVGLPLLLWSGFRTPSQYRGVIGFLASKYSTLTVSPNHFRYPFSLLTDIPLIILGAWLLVLVSPLVAERLRDRTPPSLLFIAVLPAVGFVELTLTAPTSWDYQLLPLLPFVLIPAGWALRRAFVRPHRRRVVTVLTMIACGELAFMLFAVPLAQLSLAMTPTAAFVRYLAPGIDVPYGTGSEELPRIATYINTKLPKNVRVAATYADDTLRQYLGHGRSVGPWFPNEPLASLSTDGYQYGVLVGHDMPTGTVAAQSVIGLRPVFSVRFAGNSFALIYRVPTPRLTAMTSVNLQGPWSIDARGIVMTRSVEMKNHLSISGRDQQNRSEISYLSIRDLHSIDMRSPASEFKVVLAGHGGAENVYLDLINPKTGAFVRATIYVSWTGAHAVYLPSSAFQLFATSPNSAAPTWGGTVDIRLSTDNQVNVAPYIDVVSLTVGQPIAPS